MSQTIEKLYSTFVGEPGNTLKAYCETFGSWYTCQFSPLISTKTFYLPILVRNPQIYLCVSGSSLRIYKTQIYRFSSADGHDEWDPHGEHQGLK